MAELVLRATSLYLRAHCRYNEYKHDRETSVPTGLPSDTTTTTSSSSGRSSSSGTSSTSAASTPFCAHAHNLTYHPPPLTLIPPGPLQSQMMRQQAFTSALAAFSASIDALSPPSSVTARQSRLRRILGIGESGPRALAAQANALAARMDVILRERDELRRKRLIAMKGGELFFEDGVDELAGRLRQETGRLCGVVGERGRRA